MAQFSLGVDLGGTKTEIMALDVSTGKELFRQRVATVKGSYDDTIKTISSLVFAAQDALAKATGSKSAAPIPVGIAIPGAVSQQTHTIKNANSYWLIGHDLQHDLAQVLGHDRIFLENDANCLALSEATDGAGKDGELVWGLILGTGSGSGLVHHKKLIRGRNLLAGEWGHNSLPWLTEDERQWWADVSCYCGQKYCVETFVSGTGLEREYAKQCHAYNDADCHAGKVYCSSREVMARVAQGEAAAQQSFAAYVSRLARAIANYVNFLDPDVIVLGGGMSNIDALYELLPQQVQKYIFGGEFTTPIVKNVFGDSSGIRGAAWLPRMHEELN